jgi:glucuronokinase
MIIAALGALMKFHRVPAKALTPAELAALALSVETEELRIAAGLQDRVVQSYQGLTWMDFSRDPPVYARMPSGLLPRFGLAWMSERQLGTQESGQVHTPVRFRWEQGDPRVRRAIRLIAQCAVAGRRALEAGNTRRLARLMDRNFDLRRELFGEGGAERHNLRLVELAREAGFAAKLPGSGGAALVLLEGDGDEAALARSYEVEGYPYLPIHVR